MKRIDYYAGIILLGGVMLAGQYGIHKVTADDAARKVIKAQEFQLVDADGSTKGVLKIDEKGKPELVLRQKEGGPGSLITPDSIALAGMSNDDRSGVTLSSVRGVAVFGKDGHPKAIFSVDGDQSGSILLMHPNGASSTMGFVKGKPVFGLTTQDNQTALLDGGSVGPKDTSSPAPKDGPSLLNTPVAMPGEMHEVATFDGDTGKNTDPFTVGKRWKIEWETKPNAGDTPDNFMVTIVRGSDGGDFDSLANVIGAHKATSQEYKAGTYYLKIETSQKYTIHVYSE